MTKTELMNKLSRTAHGMGRTIKKHSPTILIVAGVVGTVTSAVMACKASTKVNGVLEDTKKQLDDVKKARELVAEGNLEATEYTEEDAKKDTVIIYTQTGLKLVKMYGPAVLLGALSLAGIVTAHGIMRKRNLALVAACTAIDNNFKSYRSRLIERFGEELDHELRYNIRTKEIEEIVKDEETGEEKVIKTQVQAYDPEAVMKDVSSCFFDEYCKGWKKDPELNLLFLRTQQAMANRMLQQRGWLSLNDVYELIGRDATGFGQLIGWVYDEKNPVGDNYVDFGIYNIHSEACRDFVNGRERSILLQFNHDGDITKYIDKMY